MSNNVHSNIVIRAENLDHSLFVFYFYFVSFYANYYRATIAACSGECKRIEAERSSFTETI